VAVIFGNGLDASQLSELQSSLGIDLPSDYREFLGRYNGLYVGRPNWCQIPLDAVAQGEISFDRFYGFALENENLELLGMNAELVDELAFLEQPVVVGSDPGDNPYVLVSSGRRRGVYYWDRTGLHADDPGARPDIPSRDQSGALFRVADGFGTFAEAVIASLRKQGAEFVPSLR